MTETEGRSRIALFLDTDVADALCCYLDDEEVFPEIVDALLRSIPVPVPPPPPEWRPTASEIVQLTHRRPHSLGAEPFHEFLLRNPAIAHDSGVVFQLNQAADETVPCIEGYCFYDGDGRHWFDEHPEEDKRLIGYYHPYSARFYSTNAEMIRYLTTNGFIKKMDTDPL